MDVFAPRSINPLCFIILNISSRPRKTINIFNEPTPWMRTRDLMRVRGVAEQDIRASLLKGELKTKIQAGEITVLCSDIDLTQYNAENLAFLQSAGITNGLGNNGSGFPFLFKQAIQLNGALDGTNTVFTVPGTDKFLDGAYSGNEFHILVTHNGRELKQCYDFYISESGGVGTGYDTITTTFIPNSRSTLQANYVIENII